MRSKVFGALLVLLSVGLTASAQTTDPMQALKDSLSGGGQQGGVLQGILGNGTGTGKKSDKKLENPETVQPPDETDQIQRNIKTRDGRILRQFNEDPELRADDSVMIEMRSIDDVCSHNNLGLLPQNGNGNQNNAPNGVPGAPGANGANVFSGLNSLNTAGGVGGVPVTAKLWVIGGAAE